MQVVGTFDEKSLEMLFRAHYTGLIRFATGYVKDPEVAREIVQDSFVSLWEKRETLDMSKPVKTYLSTTVRNKCLNYLRDNRKFSSDLLALENLANEATFEEPDRLVEADLQHRIDSAIAELPPKCREIFVMNRFNHLKYQQIADQLGISVKTVETQMSKALQHLRVRLADFMTLAFMIFMKSME